jgi:DNA-binding response OmpR family regulator
MQTILILDSPEGDASVLASALRVEGYQVIQVATPAAAYEALASGDVSIAIVDLMLRTEGSSHGLELAREIRGRHPCTRVVLTSAYHLTERQLERADCGVSGFIPKPYDLAEVVAFIDAKVSAPPSSRRIWHAEPSVPPSSQVEPVTKRGDRDHDGDGDGDGETLAASPPRR